MAESTKVKKKSVPKVVKDLSWNKWVGEDIARTKCMCCGLNEIRMNSFHCGHVLAVANGGKTSIENLRPICSACNLSMGTENMEDFKKRCEFQTIVKQKVSEFDDESDTPVKWFAGILQKRTPKFIQAPAVPGLRVGSITLFDSSDEFKQDLEIQTKYTKDSNFIYKRNI